MKQIKRNSICTNNWFGIWIKISKFTYRNDTKRTTMRTHLMRKRIKNQHIHRLQITLRDENEKCPPSISSSTMSNTYYIVWRHNFDFFLVRRFALEKKKTKQKIANLKEWFEIGNDKFARFYSFVHSGKKIATKVYVKCHCKNWKQKPIDYQQMVNESSFHYGECETWWWSAK